MLRITSVLETETFDRIDKNIFLVFNSYETEVHPSVKKVASDNLFYWCCKRRVYYFNFNSNSFFNLSRNSLLLK